MDELVKRRSGEMERGVEKNFDANLMRWNQIEKMQEKCKKTIWI